MKIMYSYSRKEAIDDGVLVDLTEIIEKEQIGIFKVPVACTSSVYDYYINPPENVDEDFPPQDLNGRLYDTLFMFLMEIRRMTEDQGGPLFCKIIYQIPEGKRWESNEKPCPEAGKYAREVTLKMLSHGGDNGEHVLTIMKPEED